ncbi:MAG: hypothetical protein Q7S66_04600 [bacterium]|nr:hypothetical protein [bacterium]
MDKGTGRLREVVLKILRDIKESETIVEDFKEAMNGGSCVVLLARKE